MDFFARLFAALGFTAKPVTTTTARAATTPLSTVTIMQAESTLASNVQLTRAQVEALAKKITAQYFPAVDWRMLVTMAAIESTFMPNAQRKEYNSKGEVRDISYGLMQVLISTAEWLYASLGRRSYGPATVANLTKPETSLYYGAAYVNWLRRWNGLARSEEWIVRAYNGGPGWQTRQAKETEASHQETLSKTLNHWNKYKRQKVAFYG